MTSKRTERSETRAELNHQIRTAVKRFDLSDRTEDTWAFLCECGADGCQEWVTMPLAGYETLHRADEPILAHGHTVSRGEKARRRAMRLAEDAQALQAQARQQLKGSRKSLEGEDRRP